MDGRKDAIKNLTTAVRFWRDSAPSSSKGKCEPAYERPQAEWNKIESICCEMEALGPFAQEKDFDKLWQQLVELNVGSKDDVELKRKVSEAFYPFRDK